MADIKWIKVASDIFDDEKMLLIDTYPDADSIFVIWFKLLTLAGKQNNGGCFKVNDIPLDVEMLSSIIRRPVATVQRALDVFQRFGMVSITDDTYSVPNWNKHQTMLSRTEYMKQYMRDYRQKDKILNDVNSVNFTLTDKKTEDKNKEQKKEDRSKKTDYPTLSDVESFVFEKSLSVSARHFWEFFNDRNWEINGEPIKNWKAVMMSWQKAREQADDEIDPMIRSALGGISQ